MAEENAIEISNLNKIYKIFNRPIDRIKESLSPFHKRYSTDFYAIRNLSLNVKKGETLGVIGKNGAGKSTLLKIITGVLTPTSGHVKVNGRIASLLELGAGFNPEMTGIENIYMNGDIIGISRHDMDARINDIIAFADIGEFIHQQVKTYSSGMFARLAFSVNAFVEPDILIVDEALSVGDVFFQNKCFKKFEELKRSGVTIIFVSHDIPAVRRFCDTVLWMENGNMKELDACETVCANYLQEQLQTMNQANRDIEVQDDCKKIELNVNEVKQYPALKQSKVIASHPNLGKLVSFFITDENGKIVRELETLKTYSIHIVGEFFQNIRQVIFGITLDNAQGIQVLAMNTYMQEKRGCDVEKGMIVEAIMTFHMPMLHDGEYIISPAIAYGSQNNHINITWLPEYTNIYIVNKKGLNVSMFEVPTQVSYYASRL